MENNINDFVYKSEPQDHDPLEIKFEDEDSGSIIELQNAHIFEPTNEPQNDDYIILNAVESNACVLYGKNDLNLNNNNIVKTINSNNNNNNTNNCSNNNNNNSNDSINLNNNECIYQGDMKNKAQPKKRDDVKRMTHNEVERRRRDKINTWLIKLKELIPSDELNDNLLIQMVTHDSIKKNSNNKKGVKSSSLSNAKHESKCGIIQRACDYIREMKTELNELKQCLTENKTLKIENSALQKENQLLKLKTQSNTST